MIAETFTAWRARLERYCAQLLRNRHDSEEVVQDVFARLLARPDAYSLDGTPEVLLFRMARNACIDRLRRRRPGSAAGVDMAVADPGAPDRLEQAELIAALATLPAGERDTLLLTAVDGLGYREVAAILGCSLGTAMTHAFDWLARAGVEPAVMGMA